MAKWGEGDPRWIVEQRDDATNVNNWHWSEKNATQWSKDHIKSLLTGLVVETDICRCEVTEVTKVDGEAMANNRKGKLIFFYELVVEADWKGSLKNSDNKTTFKGKLEVPNLSEENDPDELNVMVTCTSNSDDGYKVKEVMRKVGGQQVQEKLGQYISDLKQEYSKGLILPTRNAGGQASTTSITTTNGDTTINKAKARLNQPVTSSASGPSSKQATKSLTLKEEFFCQPEDLYKVFVERDFLQAFTRGPASIEAKQGGGFSVFGGNVCGSFLRLEPPSRLTMRWRRRDWPAEVSSEVDLRFSACDAGTKLELRQTGIPEREADTTAAGWKEHYFLPIKQTFGYGLQL